MRTLLLALAVGLGAGPAAAKSPWPNAPGGADWSAMRATGERDVLAAGDNVNAWAAAQADGGVEWLRLGYPEVVAVREIHIWQNDAPGAVTRVTVMVDGQEVEVWSGVDRPKGPAPVAMAVTLAKPLRTDTVTVYLDTARVSGWNEIDAVEVVAADGRRLWASTAEASSSYPAAPGHPLAYLVGQVVSVRVEGVTVGGVVVAVDSAWMTLDEGGRRRLINMARLGFVEWER